MIRTTKLGVSIAVTILIILPITSNAFSLDDVVQRWMTFMRQKVATLESENASLKEQLKSCTPTNDSQESLQEKTKPNPTLTVTANPPIIKYGGSATINWSAEGATSCTLDSSPVLLTNIASKTTDALYKSQTYTVKCTNKDWVASESVTVEVQPYQPPAGYKLLPSEQCTRATAPCVTYGGFTMCTKQGCSHGG